MLKLIPRVSLLTVSILLTTLSLSAQSDWLQGYVVLANGDTLKGEAAYLTSELQFQKCFFKSDNQIREYLPAEILGYGINDVKKLSSQVIEGQFVEIIAFGELSLYKQGKTLFIQNTKGEAYPLSSKTKTVSNDGSDYVSEGQKWKSVLYGLVSTCDADSEVIKTLSFNEKNILNQVELYNSCKRGTTEAFTTKAFQKTLIDYKFQIGFRNNELNVSSVDGILRSADGTYSSTNFIFGLSVNFRFPNLSEKISLEIGLNHQSSIFSRVDRGRTVIREYANELKTIGIPISLKGLLIEKRVTVFVQTGISIDNYYGQSNVVYTDRITNNGITTSTADGDLEMVNSKAFFWWRLGISTPILKTYKLSFTFDSVFPSEGLIEGKEKFSPLKQTGFSLILSR